MEKTIVYKRDGKFGKPEFFIALENFRILESRETPKAYACGSWYNNNCYVDGWIAKSLCKNIEGKICCPTWVTDRWTDLTNRICRDYYNREFEVREFPTEDFGEKEPEKETIQLANGTVMSNIPSTDPDNDWEEEWPDAM